MALGIIYCFGMKTSVIGVSMENTLYNGQTILINRIAYLIMQPKSGDVIVFLPNGNQNTHYYIKRVIAVPGDISAQTISAIIADEAAIGMINNKTTAVRIIPVPGKTVGDSVEFGGLLGYSPILPVNRFSSADFIARGGRIPAPVRSLTN